MKFSEIGNVRVVEATDELGTSLMPEVSTDEPAGRQTDMSGHAVKSGPFANLSILLRRPAAPGKLIKTLRGTVEATVRAERPNPLVIVLDGAAGKTFQNADRRVVVNSIGTDVVKRQHVIRLAIDDRDQLFSAETAGTRAGSPLRGITSLNLAPEFDFDPSHWPIQIVKSNGEFARYALSIDQDSDSLILSFPAPTQANELAEIRILSLVRAREKITFEFHDLPMP